MFNGVAGTPGQRMEDRGVLGLLGGESVRVNCGFEHLCTYLRHESRQLHAGPPAPRRAG
jgi:hypothetical protein